MALVENAAAEPRVVTTREYVEPPPVTSISLEPRVISTREYMLEEPVHSVVYTEPSRILQQHAPIIVREQAPLIVPRDPVYVPTITETVYEEPVRTWLEPGPVPQTYLAPHQPYTETLLGRKVDVAEHERVVRALERRVADLEGRLSNATRSANEASNARAQLQEKCRTLEDRMSFMSGLQNTVDTLLADNRKLEAQLRQAQQGGSEVARLKNELAQVTEKCSRLASESRQLDAELQGALRARDSLAQERDSLAHELAGLEKELMQGAAGVRAVKSQMQVRISELEAELQELIATLRARDNEVRELSAQLNGHLNDKDAFALDMDRLKADNIALIREVERLTDEIRHLEMELRDLARLRAELAELRAENERLLANANARPMLGVEIKMLDDAAGNPDCVVVVHTVSPNGPADLAGLRPGDVLKEWDGILLDSKSKFQRLVDQSPPGTRIVLSIIRGKNLHPVQIPIVMGAATPGHFRTVRRVHSNTVAENVFQDPVHGHQVPGRHGRYYPYE